MEAEFERLLAQEGPFKVSSAARGALRWSCGKLTSSKSGSQALPRGSSCTSGDPSLRYRPFSFPILRGGVEPCHESPPETGCSAMSAHHLVFLGAPRGRPWGEELRSQVPTCSQVRSLCSQSLSVQILERLALRDLRGQGRAF